MNLSKPKNKLLSLLSSVLITFLGACNSSTSTTNTAPQSPFDLVSGELSQMVLGSGGPIATKAGHANAGYLIFTDGKLRVLMDVGGGTYQRLAGSGVELRDLEFMLLTHLHIDHTADLSTAIKTIYFHNNLVRSQGRTTIGETAPINVFGPVDTAFQTEPGGKYPNGTLIFPSNSGYVHNLYSIAPTSVTSTVVAGGERYLKAFVNAISDDRGSGTGVSNFAYTVTDLKSSCAAATQETVLDTVDGTRITSVAVNHESTHAMAYHIDYKEKSIVYNGDTNSRIITPVTESRTGNIIKAIKNQPFSGLIFVAKDLDVLNI